MTENSSKVWCCCNNTNSSTQTNKNSLYNRSVKKEKTADDVIANADDAEVLREEPLSKRLFRACFTLVYVGLVAVAVIVTYSMVRELVHSLKHPVRSINFKKNDFYEAPGGCDVMLKSFNFLHKNYLSKIYTCFARVCN